MTKKKRDRRDRESKKVKNASPAPARDGAGSSGSARTAAVEHGEDEKVASSKEDFLCTFICDLLADLPRSSNQLWDQEICRRISVGLKKCHLHDKESVKELNDSDVITVDIRGRYVVDAKSVLMMHLCRCSQIPDVKYLKVTVGCKVHGVGKGKLRKAITQLLALDKTIVWKKADGGSVISIKIDDEKDYSSLECHVSKERQLFGPVEGFSEKDPLVQFMEAQASEEEEEDDFLCTFISDFLFGIPKSASTCWDNKMCKRIAAGLSCDRAEKIRLRKFNESNGILEDTATIGVRSQYVEDAIPMVKRDLYHLSCMFHPVASIRFLNIEVGCKIHGVGKGKLKQAIIDLLEMEEDLKWRDVDGGSVISIRLDGRQYFNFLGDDFDPLHQRFGDFFDDN